MHVNTCKYKLNLGECNAQEPFLFFHILEILRDFWNKRERTVHKKMTLCSVILVFCSYWIWIILINRYIKIKILKLIVLQERLGHKLELEINLSSVKDLIIFFKARPLFFSTCTVDQRRCLRPCYFTWHECSLHDITG